LQKIKKTAGNFWILLLLELKAKKKQLPNSWIMNFLLDIIYPINETREHFKKKIGNKHMLITE